VTTKIASKDLIDTVFYANIIGYNELIEIGINLKKNITKHSTRGCQIVRIRIFG
jgi:hypothetical protein